MATDLNMCTTALYLIGADGIESFEDDSREARICSRIYEDTKKSLLSSATWNFSLAMVKLAGVELAEDSAERKFGYIYEYQLPPDYLRLIKKNSPSDDYMISRDKLYTNDSEVEILYQYNVSESEFPAYFTRALELGLTVLLSAAILQDESQVQIWQPLARAELSRAKVIDAQSTPPDGIPYNNFALVSVR